MSNKFPQSIALENIAVGKWIHTFVAQCEDIEIIRDYTLILAMAASWNTSYRLTTVLHNELKRDGYFKEVA